MTGMKYLNFATKAASEVETHREPRIGHVHLRVADVERATNFYRDVLGFKVVCYGPTMGLPMAFLAAGDYHHHIALNAFDSTAGTPPPNGHTGLHHFAVLYPDLLSLSKVVGRVLECGLPLRHTRDHGATLSFYLQDPDGNEVELYYDRPPAHWLDLRVSQSSNPSPSI